jgi:predicted glycosyl hydrolase (DUF1957 family)
VSDWNAFLRSDDFRAYRRKQVEMAAAHLKKAAYQLVTNGKVDLAALQGKLEMINLFLKLPDTLTHDKELKELLSVQMDEDTGNIAQYLIRLSLAE